MKRTKIYYREGFKYQLNRDVYFQLKYTLPEHDVFTNYLHLASTGMLSINWGYPWDGASGVRDTKSIMPGTLAHDALYELMRKGLLPRRFRLAADKDFRRINRASGMNGLRSKYIYRGVRLGGRRATLASHKKKVLVAP